MTRETSAEIDDAAAAWVARIDAAPLTAEETARLEDWLADDVRRVGAFAKAHAVMVHLERAKALGPSYDPDAFLGAATRRPVIGRRSMLIGAGGLAAALAAIGVGASLSLAADHVSTRRGEVRLVPLEDGSVVTLNTASKIIVRYTKTRREIRLIKGEVLFDVAKNKIRPFIVTAGSLSVRAVGTSFTVRNIEGSAPEVLVREGVVEISRAASPLSQPQAGLRLIANERLAAPGDEPLAALSITPKDLDRELAWREGMLSFEGASLRDAAAEFARYSDPKIVIDDHAVGQRKVTGLFSANNPTGFAGAAALSLDLQTYSSGGEIHIR